MTDKDEKFSDQEATRRVEKALRAAFSAPHKTYEELKVGKRRRNLASGKSGKETKSKTEGK